ncbi:MAG TPA: amidophosphoribosyltransferase, partial [Gemmatimonadaceae bacterium]|nr:amidophosphoribosyltransferase [Gemmatimonadaceae bacterium]
MCGIFGVRGNPQAAELVHLGLYSLQHRGQESSGIVTVDDAGRAHSVRAMGLVSEGLAESEMPELIGSTGIGHTRY